MWRAAGTVRRMTRDRQAGPGLKSTGNRVFLGVAVGLLLSIFAGLLDAPTAVRIVVLVLGGGITYALATVAARR